MDKKQEFFMTKVNTENDIVLNTVVYKLRGAVKNIPEFRCNSL